MRSQKASAFTTPALVSGVAGCASESFHTWSMASPRPGLRPVRSTPRMLMLYLIDGIPASAQFLMRVCNCSMSRSRSGLCGQHDGRMLFLVDEARGQKRRRDAVHADVVFRGQVLHALELVHGGVEPVAFNLRDSRRCSRRHSGPGTSDAPRWWARSGRPASSGSSLRQAPQRRIWDAPPPAATSPAAPLVTMNCLRFMAPLSWTCARAENAAHIALNVVSERCKRASAHL